MQVESTESTVEPVRDRMWRAKDAALLVAECALAQRFKKGRYTLSRRLEPAHVKEWPKDGSDLVIRVFADDLVVLVGWGRHKMAPNVVLVFDVTLSVLAPPSEEDDSPLARVNKVSISTVRVVPEIENQRELAPLYEGVTYYVTQMLNPGKDTREAILEDERELRARKAREKKEPAMRRVSSVLAARIPRLFGHLARQS